MTQPAQQYANDHLIVSLRPEVRVDAKGLTTHVASLDRSLESLNAVELTPLRATDHLYRLKLGKGTDIQKAVETLNQDPAVEYAEPDYLAKFASAPDDPRYSEQWSLAKVQAEGAWAETMGTSTVVIAIIDSGIDLTHEDLTPNLWVNPGEIAANGLDDDNNGFIDDVQGWNFIDQNNDPQDYIGHGSLVAGVAAARSNNGVGIAGVCGNCRIMPVKITQLSGFANYSDIAAGIYYAADKGAKVINLSVGGYANSITVQNAINYALNKNIVVVAGAGNDNKSDLFYPAAYEGVIAVAGTDSGDIKVNSSNYGAWVDISAPGIDILSTTLGDYASDSGTSYATPFVSGAAGLLLSLHPEWTPAMVRAQFLHTTDAIDSLNPSYAGKLGTGRLNLTTAIQSPHPILSYKAYTGNGVDNLRPDFGSTVDLKVTLYNDWADATEVSGVLTSSDPYVTIATGTADYGTIPSGESVSNAVAFTFDIATGAGYNHGMPFSLELSANGGAYSTTVNFTITTRTSEEVVSGTIESDTTWTSDKTYKVTGNVGVPPDVILTIQPGTVVQFAGNYQMNVGGTLIASGTVEQRIRFEPYTAGSTWNRIFFDDLSTDAQVTMEGDYISGSVLQYVNMTGASGGIACATATPYLNNVSTNLGGLTCALGDTDLWLTDSGITGTVNITQGGAAPEHLTGVEITGNTTLPASLVSSGQFSGSLAINGNATIASTTVGSLAISGVGDIQDVTTTNGGISMTSGQVLWSNVTGGSISASSASTIATNTVRGGSISVGTGNLITRNDIQDASGVGINSSGSNTITYNRVVGTQKGIVTGAGIVENNLIANTTGNGLEPGSASVRNNTLIGIQGHGVYLNAVPAAFTANNFEFNTGTYDVYLTVPKTTTINLIAQDNWWGTTSSSEISARVYDYNDGDFTLAKLITVPVATMPVQTAPGYVRSVTLDPSSPVGIQTVNFTIEFSRPMDVSNYAELSFLSTLAGTWATKADMPTERDLFGAAYASNGKIYAIGGRFNEDTVSEYDPLTDTWINRTPMPIGRSELGVIAASNGMIYAIGGNGSSAVQEYNPLTNTWTNKASMPTGRGNLGVAAATNGKIYAVGGANSGLNEIYSTVEEYDPFNNTWTTKASMPTARRGLGVAAATNGKIYAIGGYDSHIGALDIVEEYDPLTDTWTTKTSLPSKSGGLAAIAASNGKIYTFGGSTYEYDPLTDSWKINTSMPTFRIDLGVAEGGDGKIYVIGGYSGGLLSTVEEYTPPDWGFALINFNPRWLDDTHYRASYNFTTLNPRGEYRLTVEGITDSDGMLIVPNSSTIFTIDYAGEISDTTPPDAPSVVAWGNGSLSQLSAQASASDPDSQIAGYRYAIGTTPDATDVVSWTNVATNTITHSGLVLQAEQPYYISFMARNTGGLWSPVGSSNAVINGEAPLPVLSSQEPTSTLAGGSEFTLLVTGQNFINGSVIRWNGAAKPTTYLAPTQLSTSISAADIATPGAYTVTVFTPAPGGGESSALDFSVIATNPMPIIYNLTPASTVAGGAGFTLLLTGKDFIAGSEVRWQGSTRSTTYINSTRLSAAISAADIAVPGGYTVTVFTPAPGGGESSSFTFSVMIPETKVFIPIILK